MTRRLPVALGAIGLLLMAAVLAPALPEERLAYAAGDCTLAAGANPALDADEQQFLALINAYRAEHGLGALTAVATLNHSSAYFAAEMGHQDFFGHNEPSGRGLSERLHDCGWPAGGWEGENLAAGNPLAAPEKVLQVWQDSPGHNENMLRAEFTVIGIARETVAGSTYGTYWVTDFGSLADPGAGPPPAPTATPTTEPTPAVEPTATPTAVPTATPTPVPTATRTASPTPVPEPTATSEPQPGGGTSQALEFDFDSGTHLVIWPEAATPVSQAIAGHEAEIIAIFGWGPSGWERYVPGREEWLNSLTVFEPNKPYWIVVR